MSIRYPDDAMLPPTGAGRHASGAAEAGGLPADRDRARRASLPILFGGLPARDPATAISRAETIDPVVTGSIAAGVVRRHVAGRRSARRWRCSTAECASSAPRLLAGRALGRAQRIGKAHAGAARLAAAAAGSRAAPSPTAKSRRRWRARARRHRRSARHRSRRRARARRGGAAAGRARRARWSAPMARRSRIRWSAEA